MIERDQVLHVAKLARLRVSHDEVDKVAGELSKILEYVETMNELDLEGVQPTSHVVDLTNVLREDVPRRSLDRDTAAIGYASSMRLGATLSSFLRSRCTPIRMAGTSTIAVTPFEMTRLRHSTQ